MVMVLPWQCHWKKSDLVKLAFLKFNDSVFKTAVKFDISILEFNPAPKFRANRTNDSVDSLDPSDT